MLISYIEFLDSQTHYLHKWVLHTSQVGYASRFFCLEQKHQPKRLLSVLKFLFLGTEASSGIDLANARGTTSHGESWILKRQKQEVRLWINRHAVNIHNPQCDIIEILQQFHDKKQKTIYEVNEVVCSCQKEDEVLLFYPTQEASSKEMNSLSEYYFSLMKEVYHLLGLPLTKNQEQLSKIYADLAPKYEQYKKLIDIKNSILSQRKTNYDVLKLIKVREKLTIIDEISAILAHFRQKHLRLPLQKQEIIDVKKMLKRLYATIKDKSQLRFYPPKLYRKHIDLLTKIHLQEKLIAQFQSDETPAVSKSVQGEILAEHQKLLSSWKCLAEKIGMDSHFRLNDLYNLLLYSTDILHLEQQLEVRKRSLSEFIQQQDHLVHLIKRWRKIQNNQVIEDLQTYFSIVREAQMIINQRSVLKEEKKLIERVEVLAKGYENTSQFIRQNLANLRSSWQASCQFWGLSWDIREQSEIIEKFLNRIHHIKFLSSKVKNILKIPQTFSLFISISKVLAGEVSANFFSKILHSSIAQDVTLIFLVFPDDSTDTLNQLFGQLRYECYKASTKALPVSHAMKVKSALDIFTRKRL